MTQVEFGVLVGRSANAVCMYEHGWRRPPAVFFLDLLDSLPLPGVTFNEIAEWFSYRPVATIDPWAFSSIHEYVAGVRIFHHYSRAAFAATLGCHPASLHGYEHHVKPDEAVLRRLSKRHLRPKFSYSSLINRFRTLRPSDDDLTLRAQFAELRNTPTDSARHRVLRDQLIEDHLHVAHELGRRYRHRDVSMEDAQQVAAEALVRAVDRCDPRFGDFSPYLRKWVQGSIRQYAYLSWTPGTATVIRTYGGVIGKAREELLQEHAREPTAGELATRLGLPVRIVQQTLTAMSARQTLSLDTTGERDDRPLAQRIADTAPEATHTSESVRRLLDSLDPATRDIVAMRYLHDNTVDEIASRSGLPAPDIETLLANALDQLRRTGPREPIADTANDGSRRGPARSGEVDVDGLARRPDRR